MLILRSRILVVAIILLAVLTLYSTKSLADVTVDVVVLRPGTTTGIPGADVCVSWTGEREQNGSYSTIFVERQETTDQNGRARFQHVAAPLPGRNVSPSGVGIVINVVKQGVGSDYMTYNIPQADILSAQTEIKTVGVRLPGNNIGKCAGETAKPPPPPPITPPSPDPPNLLRPKDKATVNNSKVHFAAAMKINTKVHELCGMAGRGTSLPTTLANCTVSNRGVSRYGGSRNYTARVPTNVPCSSNGEWLTWSMRGCNSTSNPAQYCSSWAEPWEVNCQGGGGMVVEPPPPPDDMGDAERAKDAFNQTISVWRSPRCTNCHTDASLPPVSHPSTYGSGVSVIGNCDKCHSSNRIRSNLGAPLPPGGIWHMANVANTGKNMVLESNSSASTICNMVKTNKGGSAQAVLTHVQTDQLIAWAFNPICAVDGSTTQTQACPNRPGAGNKTNFANHLQTWVNNGGHCP